MVRVPGLRAGRRGLLRLVETADSARSRIPAPIVVAPVGLLIAESDESLTSLSLRRKHRVKPEQPEPIGLLEIRIDRHRLDLDAPDQIITGVMSDLIILDHVVGLFAPPVYALAIVKSQVVVVGEQR